MKYYPVFIPTLNRFTHFRNCVESLSCCTYADKTELVIGLDYPPSEKFEEGYREIKKYIPTISGFAKVTVFEHDKNLGPGGNWRYLVEYCKQHYDAYIGTEDDNVFAPAFLDYMDKALEMFRDDERIVTVSGYNFIDAYKQGIYTCYLSKDNCAWGTGYWTHKENVLIKYFKNEEYFEKILYSHAKGGKIIKTYPQLYDMLNSMVVYKLKWGDVMRTTVNILENYCQLKPSVSLVRNCGFDGSGVHCTDDEFQLGQQPISNSETFDFSNGIGSADTINNKLALYNHVLPLDPLKREKQLKYIYELYSSNTSLLRKWKRLKYCLAIQTCLKSILKKRELVADAHRYFKKQ